jgi:EAL domain-containing protein (putative c-di-GMP-specific phosphodiesterase class I)/GGDEF domain-containing protein
MPLFKCRALPGPRFVPAARRASETGHARVRTMPVIMSGDLLIGGLPDLVMLLRRDGTVLAQGGGESVGELRPTGSFTGKRITELFSESVASLLQQLTRSAIAKRGGVEARFQENGESYEARVHARGPDRVLCVIRHYPEHSRDSSLESTGPRPQLDRRGFLKRFRESLSLAALREKPLAVAVIQVDGVADIARVIAPKVSEQIMSAALIRLSDQSAAARDGAAMPPWYLGQLNESVLAVVVESSDRVAIEACISQVCASLREPVKIGDAEFHLTPWAGVGVLGQDASSPKLLLEHARAAAAEARRSGIDRVSFFTDSLRLKSLARLDLARELREAIGNGDIRLRYVSRCDLSTGEVVARVGYLQWIHPLRGEIRPAEFVRVAEATGLAAALSRAALACLERDFAALALAQSDAWISYGALRHHVLHEGFIDDIAALLEKKAIPAGRLELRIAEKTFVMREPEYFKAFERLGVRLVVDEVARGMGSLQRLARAPLWGLQLDRAWVTALRTDEVARKVCRAGISVATALGLTPIATGVDDAAQRDALLALGCRFGSGDLYPQSAADITVPAQASA